MAEIGAFRGIRYNPSIVGDLTQVITPPYDVIGEPLQEALYQRSPHNMVRLDFGKTYPGDDAGENRYTRSGALFGQWLREGVLRVDTAPAVYWLEEDYALEDGSPCTRKGFVASVRIEDAGSGLYRPHEKTHAKPKEDRIRLTRACKANLSPIFSLYDDPDLNVSPVLEKAALATEPAARVTDDGGVETRMWCVSDPEVVAAVAAGMQGKSFFIADGHHRYETALAHRAWMREQCPGARGEGAWNYVMMYLSNMRDPGLTVFPTHRAVFGLGDLDVAGFLHRAEEFFSVEAVAEGTALLGAVAGSLAGRQRFGLCAKGTPGGWVLTLRERVDLSVVLGRELPAVLRDLDVTVGLTGAWKHDQAANMDNYFVGVDGGFKLDMVDLDGFFVYNFGTNDGALASGKDQDISAWALSLNAKAKVSAVKVGGGLLVMSADDDEDDDMSLNGGQGSFQFYDAGLQIFLADIYYNNQAGRGAGGRLAIDDAGAAGYGLFGLWVNGAMDLPAVKGMYVKGAAGYFAALDDKTDKDNTTKTEGTQLGFELAAMVGIKVAGAADFSLRGAYAVLGDFYDKTAAGAKDPDDLYNVVLMLNVPY